MESKNEQEFVRIVVLDNLIEAQVVTSILEEQGIPHLFRSYRDTAYNGLFQMQKGWGVVMAPEDRKTEILEIVEDLRKSPPPPVSGQGDNRPGS